MDGCLSYLNAAEHLGKQAVESSPTATTVISISLVKRFDFSLKDDARHSCFGDFDCFAGVYLQTKRPFVIISVACGYYPTTYKKIFYLAK